MNNNGYGHGGGGWNGNMSADSSLYLMQAGGIPFGHNIGYSGFVTQYGAYGTPSYVSSNNADINDGSNWSCNSPVRSVLYPTEVELNAGLGSGYNDNATNQGPYANVDSKVSYGQSVNYNNEDVTVFKTYNVVETEEYIHMYFDDEQVWKRLSKKTTEKQEAGFDGKASIRTEIKAKGIPLCESIWFFNAYKFNREDMPKKEYYCVSYKTKSHSDITIEVVEKSEVESNKFCLKIFPEGVKAGRETECSEFYRSTIYKLASENPKITIPDLPGWNHSSSGWRFLERSCFKDLGKVNLPVAMSRRFVGKTDRSVNEVLTQLRQLLASNEKLISLMMLKMSGPLQIFHERHGNSSHIMPFVKIGNTLQIKVASAILKDSDFAAYNIISIDSYIGDIKKEIKAGQDGITAFLGPLTAAEAKSNNKQVRETRNAAIGAVKSDSVVRSIITLIGRFIPAAISEEFIFNIDCTGIPGNIDLKLLRSLSLELIAALIAYIENNFEKVEGIVKRTIDSYKSEPDTIIPFQYQGLYIMFLSVRAVVRECFGTELITDDVFEKIKILFTKAEAESITPDYNVRDQFIDVAFKLLCNGKFIIIELKDARKNYPKEGIVLILDRKKGLLNFTKAALDLIAEMIPGVKNGDELAGILKDCKTIYWTDNGARQVTISGKRTEFYSVYLSEFGDDILDLIDNLDTEEFFFDPREVPQNFVPILWRDGRCAGFVLDGKGLPNPHINISGLSGMGKNRGAYKTSEGYWRLMAKVIFLDVKGGGTEESLRDMKCDLSRYHFHDLKQDGFPFPIFNLSAFAGQNAKRSYILNVIGAAVGLTPLQMNELSDYVDGLISDEKNSFSLYELIESIPSQKSIALKNKLQPFLKLMEAYNPQEGKYKYKSCVEFINDSSKIMILSIAQESQSALRLTVYSMLQAIFEHRVVDSSKRLVIYADEIQKYTADSPFRKLYAEAREFKTCMGAMTQEYRAPGDETKKMSSNAAMEIFYPPTYDSEDRVSKRLGKKYSPDTHRQKGVGYIWGSGYFWSKVDNAHKFVTLRGWNDDEKFIDLQSTPEGYYGTGY